MGNNRNGLTEQQVLKAAKDCFQRYGVSRTSMADVAKELGVSRQTIYRLFDSRSDLLEAVGSEQISKMAKQLSEKFASYDSLEEALVEGSMLSMAVGRTDKLFTEIVEQSDDHQFTQFLFRGSEEVRNIMLELWTPLLDQARATGKLKSEKSNEQIVEWIRNIHSVAAIRADYDEAHCRTLFSDFLVPSLIVR